MFPEQFVQKQLVYSVPGDVVLDPFAGRGTTVFEALLNERRGLGGDTNPVAVCVAGAKADPPRLGSIVERVKQLEGWCADAKLVEPEMDDEFFQMCFATETLRQVLFLRRVLNRANRTDRFIAALCLGCLHGESHRTRWCFSNRMPRTISTKPGYSIKWWRARGEVAPRRDAFAILREVAKYRYESPMPRLRGRVAQADARRIGVVLRAFRSAVSLVITSPPYLDTTNYAEDQWLRLWFLGGAARPTSIGRFDDRHRSEETYWTFLTEAWAGVRPLLKDGARMVIRIGGRHLEGPYVRGRLRSSLAAGLDTRVRLMSSYSSVIRNGQVHAFRPGIGVSLVEHDFHFRVQ